MAALSARCPFPQAHPLIEQSLAAALPSTQGFPAAAAAGSGAAAAVSSDSITPTCVGPDVSPPSSLRNRTEGAFRLQAVAVWWRGRGLTRRCSLCSRRGPGDTRSGRADTPRAVAAPCAPSPRHVRRSRAGSLRKGNSARHSRRIPDEGGLGLGQTCAQVYEPHLLRRGARARRLLWRRDGRGGGGSGEQRRGRGRQHRRLRGTALQQQVHQADTAGAWGDQRRSAGQGRG